jgi:hypothetical protein
MVRTVDRDASPAVPLDDARGAKRPEDAAGFRRGEREAVSTHPETLARRAVARGARLPPRRDRSGPGAAAGLRRAAYAPPRRARKIAGAHSSAVARRAVRGARSIELGLTHRARARGRMCANVAAIPRSPSSRSPSIPIATTVSGEGGAGTYSAFASCTRGARSAATWPGAADAHCVFGAVSPDILSSTRAPPHRDEQAPRIIAAIRDAILSGGRRSSLRRARVVDPLIEGGADAASRR